MKSNVFTLRTVWHAASGFDRARRGAGNARYHGFPDGGRHRFAAFVTEIAQLQRRLVTQENQYDHRSRCPGEVPSSPWRLTGSGKRELPETSTERSRAQVVTH
jgi:hypothetical protein